LIRLNIGLQAWMYIVNYSMNMGSERNDARLEHVGGGGGMWFGPLGMILWLVVLVAVIVALVRWLGGTSGGADRSGRSARDTLDDRYARGEIDREEYMKRKQDIAGR
jgi:putative membrane protein